MGQRADVVDKNLDVFVAEARSYINHLVSVNVILVRPSFPRMKVIQLATEVAAIQ